MDYLNMRKKEIRDSIIEQKVELNKNIYEYRVLCNDGEKIDYSFYNNICIGEFWTPKKIKNYFQTMEIKTFAQLYCETEKEDFFNKLKVVTNNSNYDIIQCLKEIKRLRTHYLGENPKIKLEGTYDEILSSLPLPTNVLEVLIRCARENNGHLGLVYTEEWETVLDEILKIGFDNEKYEPLQKYGILDKEETLLLSDIALLINCYYHYYPLESKTTAEAMSLYLKDKKENEDIKKRIENIKLKQVTFEHQKVKH